MDNTDTDAVCFVLCVFMCMEKESVIVEMAGQSSAVEISMPIAVSLPWQVWPIKYGRMLFS